MKSLIYLELINEISFAYHKEFLVKIKEAFPDLEAFDLDSFSDSILLNYAVDLIKKSDQVVLVIIAHKDASPSKLMGLFEEIINNKAKTIVLLKGENKMMEKISRQFGKVYLNENVETSLKLINSFLITGSHSQGNNS